MTDNAISCAVVSPDPTFCARVRNLAADARHGIRVVTEVTTPLADLEAEVVDHLRKSDVRIIVLDLGREPNLGLRLARTLAEADPGRTFVLTGPRAEPELLLEAMRVGASEYLPHPVEEADLSAALHRAVRRVGGMPVSREGIEPGKVYALFGAKGGVGVTTMAVNLAVDFAQVTHRPTLLVDLDLDLGGSALLLGTQPRYSVFDVVRNLHRMDQNLLSSLVEHHDTGIDILASPAQMNTGDTLGREQVRAVMTVLRRYYEHIVLDLPRAISPLTLGALEIADQVLLVANPDLPTLRNTKRVLPQMQRVSAVEGKVRVILNRHRSADLITPSDVGKALGLDVFWTLPSDEDGIGGSVNEGVPVVLRANSKYAKDLRALGAKLVGTNGTNGKSQGFVSGLLRPFRREGGATRR